MWSMAVENFMQLGKCSHSVGLHRWLSHKHLNADFADFIVGIDA